MDFITFNKFIEMTAKRHTLMKMMKELYHKINGMITDGLGHGYGYGYSKNLSFA